MENKDYYGELPNKYGKHPIQEERPLEIAYGIKPMDEQLVIECLKPDTKILVVDNSCPEISMYRELQERGVVIVNTNDAVDLLKQVKEIPPLNIPILPIIDNYKYIEKSGKEKRRERRALERKKKK